METIGYFLLLFMGLTLGVIGAGGSILTIPILVYFFKLPMILATTYSFFIVGASSLIGVLRYRHLVHFKRLFGFAVPSLLGIFISRSYILPWLLSLIGASKLELVLLLLLIALMFGSSYFMTSGTTRYFLNNKQSMFLSIIVGLVLGIVMGLLGTGGGFLIIPALIALLGVEVKRAAASSLFIVTFNSIIGFISDRVPLTITDYKKLFLFTAIALSGMWIGTHLSSKVSDSRLKRTFGAFIAIVALTIVTKEFYFK